MMNIRDYSLINKPKIIVKILELLGFEPDIQIDTYEINNLKGKIGFGKEQLEIY